MRTYFGPAQPWMTIMNPSSEEIALGCNTCVLEDEPMALAAWHVGMRLYWGALYVAELGRSFATRDRAQVFASFRIGSLKPVVGIVP